MWGKTHCFDVQCKLYRNSMHLSCSVNRVGSQLQPELICTPPLLKYATQLPKSNSNCQRVHEGRPPGPCINCKREDVTKRYWHLSQRRDQPLFYTFVKNAYAFKGITHSKMIMMTVFVECVRLDLENHSKCPTIQKQHQAKENWENMIQP